MIEIAGLELYTIQELANKIHLSDRSIRNYIHDGKLKARKVGQRWYISTEAIREYFGQPANK